MKCLLYIAVVSFMAFITNLISNIRLVFIEAVEQEKLIASLISDYEIVFHFIAVFR